MATLNAQGNIAANCPGCGGALTSFLWQAPPQSGAFGAVNLQNVPHPAWGVSSLDYRLFRCSGCGRGAIAAVAYRSGSMYPGDSSRELHEFWPEAKERLTLPKSVPEG